MAARGNRDRRFRCFYMESWRLGHSVLYCSRSYHNGLTDSLRVFEWPEGYWDE